MSEPRCQRRFHQVAHLITSSSGAGIVAQQCIIIQVGLSARRDSERERRRVSVIFASPARRDPALARRNFARFHWWPGQAPERTNDKLIRSTTSRRKREMSYDVFLAFARECRFKYPLEATNIYFLPLNVSYVRIEKFIIIVNLSLLFTCKRETRMSINFWFNEISRNMFSFIFNSRNNK